MRSAPRNLQKVQGDSQAAKSRICSCVVNSPQSVKDDRTLFMTSPIGGRACFENFSIKASIRSVNVDGRWNVSQEINRKGAASLFCCSAASGYQIITCATAKIPWASSR